MSSVQGVRRALELAAQRSSASGLENQPGSRKEGIGGAQQAAETFGRLLTQAVEDLNRVNAEANEAMARLAAGEPVELHDVMIAMEQADLSLRLALQVRNKLIEAYQEIQRMQV